MMLSISPLMTGIAAVTLPLSVGLMALVVKMSQKHFRTQQSALGEINGQIEENFAGQLVIKAFNKEKDITKTFDETNAVLYGSAWKAHFLSGLMPPVMMFVGNLGYVAVAISGAMMAIRGRIGIGDIQAFIQYVKNFTQPIQQIGQVINQIQSMMAASERVFEFLDEVEEEVVLTKETLPNQVQGEVEFKHLQFGYTPDKRLMKDINVKVKAGQKVAIVGPTGAGKTTLIKLIMRLYDPSEGEILYNGINIKEFEPNAYRKMIGTVFQDFKIFATSIAENVMNGEYTEKDRETVLSALKAADFTEKLDSLKDGIDTHLTREFNSKGTNLSGGESQKIAISRGFAKHYPIVIMDEPSSALDPMAEYNLNQSILESTEEKTVIFISHRLSTTRIADKIYMFDTGALIEEGSHEELITMNGKYAEMFRVQAQYYVENQTEEAAAC